MSVIHGWHSDPAIHQAHTAVVREVTRIEDPAKRHLFCLRQIEAASATSALSGERFRTWAMVMAQAAQDPGLFKEDT